MQDDNQNQPPVVGGTPPTPPTPDPTPTPTPTPPIVEDVPGLGSTPSSAPLSTPTPVTDSTTPAPASPMAPVAAPAKSKKKLIIILAVIVVVLAIGAAVLYFLVFSGTGSANGTSATATLSSILPAAQKEEITATKSSDLSEVCNGKKITNAPALKKPYRVASFNQFGTDTWYILAYFGEGTDNLSFELDTANAIACLSPDISTATGGKACTVKDVADEKDMSVTYKGVTQTLTFYDAQTGKKLQESKIVTTDETCPDYSYTKDVTYATPTNDQLEPEFTKFFAN